jgi:hypothetical protein
MVLGWTGVWSLGLAVAFLNPHLGPPFFCIESFASHLREGGG